MSTAPRSRGRRILITGMSGVGKSTVLAVLAARGHRVQDLDDAGWSYERVTAGGGVEQLWDEVRVMSLLRDPDPRPLALAGCASNQGDCYGALDAVLLLDVPQAVMLDRIATRPGTGFGKDPASRARVLSDAAEVLPVLRRTSTTVIDATRPLDAVVDEVEGYLNG